MRVDYIANNNESQRITMTLWSLLSNIFRKLEKQEKARKKNLWDKRYFFPTVMEKFACWCQKAFSKEFYCNFDVGRGYPAVNGNMTAGPSTGNRYNPIDNLTWIVAGWSKSRLTGEIMKGRTIEYPDNREFIAVHLKAMT